jgi:hypothetical protein
MTGNCTASGTTYAIAGCNGGTSGGYFKITGNLIWGLRQAAITGGIEWTPGETNYILMPANASYDQTVTANATEAPSPASISTQTNVKSGVKYGTYTGTASAGGGAWGF